jgi:hypothetical protein
MGERRYTMTTQQQTNHETETKMYNERLTFYHANGQGTGAAVQLEPRLNQQPGDRYNCFFLEMARQKSVAHRGEGGAAHATFDWEQKITVKLDFTDISELLTVLDGVTDHVGGKREMLYHQSGDANTMIRFSRHESGGIALSLSRKSAGDGQPNRIGTVLSQAESVGLRHVFQVGLFFITFPAIAADRGRRT